MTIDALVVGGGPVGLALGCELFRHGLRCRVIEQKTEREPWSKAAGIQPRTLEVFRHMGVIDRILAGGNRIFGFNIHRTSGDRLAHIELRVPGTAYPFILGLSQRETERVLEERLEELGGSLERGVALESFEQSGGAVQATLSDGSELEVPYLIGCDGARSKTRELLGLSFEGSTFEQELIHADLRASIAGADPHEAQLFLSDDGPLAFLPLFGEDRYRMIVLAPGDELGEPTLDNFRAHLDRRGPGGIELSDPEWMVGFRFHGRMVERYRVDRVFLAGDAAHIHSPAGGQGMNLGIQDAFNLAWKLALVSRGRANPALLDSYDAERRPVAEQIVSTTDVATRRGLRAMMLRNPIATALRDQLIRLMLNLDFITDRAAFGMAGLGVSYERSPIVGQYHSSVWSANIAGARDESPTLGDWIRSSEVRRPGERVADVELPGTEDTLLDHLAEPRHHLLLFDGAIQSESGYQTLVSVADEVRDRYGGDVAVRIFVTAAGRLEWDGPVIGDLDLEVHTHFGARSESLYLVRPDGYVAYRCQPIEPERLREYLAALFAR